MLIFERKPGETFFIGENIEITIFKSSDKKVKVGVRAPKEYAIERDDMKKKNSDPQSNFF